MSEQDLPDVESQSDEQLKAVLAAFGADAMDFLDEEEDPTDVVFQSFPGLDNLDDPDNTDSPRLMWMKRLTKEIYADRLLAMELDDQDIATGSSGTENRFMCFIVGGERYGVPLESVIEIARPPQITKLPRTPNWLRGIANVRGTIYSVIDFRSLTNNPSPRPTTGEKLIAIRGNAKSASTTLLVDLVTGIHSFQDIVDDPETFAPDTESYTGAMTCSADGSVTTLIDADKLLTSTELLTV